MRFEFRLFRVVETLLQRSWRALLDAFLRRLNTSLRNRYAEREEERTDCRSLAPKEKRDETEIDGIFAFFGPPPLLPLRQHRERSGLLPTSSVIRKQWLPTWPAFGNLKHAVGQDFFLVVIKYCRSSASALQNSYLTHHWSGFNNLA